MGRTMSLIPFALVAAAAAEMVRVPGGYTVDKRCIAEVPRGSVATIDADYRCPFAPAGVAAPQVQNYAMITSTAGGSAKVQMNTSWNVPNFPVTPHEGILFFWPGFKAHQPKIGYPVLQPVLMYNQGGRNYELQSWFVDGHTGAARTGKAISVEPGDFITSYMTYDEETKEWTISGTCTRTKEESVLQISYERSANTDYDYAVLVLEIVMNNPSNCHLYPKNPSNVTFSNLIVNNSPAKFGNATYGETSCGQKMTQQSNGDITLTWTN